MINDPPLSSRLCLLVSALALTVGQGAYAADEALDRDAIFEEAKGNLRSEDPESAYRLLIQYEENLTGSDTYNYLLGVSALDSGRAGEAIFSLQRLVVREPDFAGGRMELARAYFEVGDNELARTEFERLLEESPPEKARIVIIDYLDAIDTRARDYQSSSDFFVEFGSGYDSNPAASTADDQFLNFFLADENVEQESSYAELSAGALWTNPLTPDAQLVVNGSIAHRSNPSAHYVDPTNAMAGATVNWRSGENSASVGLTAMKMNLDGESNKTDYALTLTYSHLFSDTWSFDSFGRIGTARYTDELEIQDADQYMVGLGATYWGHRSRINFALITQQDDARETGSVFSNDGLGVRIMGVWRQPKNRSYSLELMALETEYDDPFFGAEREDDLYAITLGATWERFLARGWSLTVRLSYSEKDSTVSLYGYDRLEGGIVTRKEF